MTQDQRNHGSKVPRIPKPIRRSDYVLVSVITFVPLLVFIIIVARSSFYIQGPLLYLVPFAGFVIALAVYAWALIAKRKQAVSLLYSGLIAATVGVLSAFAMPVTVVDIDNPAEASTKDNLRAIQKGLEAYSEKHNGVYPDEITQLVQDAF